jgi:hypothetical protein
MLSISLYVFTSAERGKFALPPKKNPLSTCLGESGALKPGRSAGILSSCAEAIVLTRHLALGV